MYIVPNSTETRNFADEMQKYWSKVNWPLPGNGPFVPLGFAFLNTENELEAAYADKNISIPVQLAIVFEGNPSEELSVISLSKIECFSWLIIYYLRSYTIRNHPDLAPLPAPSKLYAPGDSCR